MKRENLENKKENKFSENFFSNKINKREKTMKIEIQKNYSVNGKNFDSIEKVNKYLLEELFTNITIEEIIQNPENFISKIREYTSNPEKSQNSEKNIPRNIGKKNMKDIKEFLKKENFEIERLSDTTRKASDWPVYLISNLENLYTIRYTKAVFELYIDLEEFGIENLVQKYSYKM